MFGGRADRRAAQAVGEIKRLLLDNGALGAVMSGLPPRFTVSFPDEVRPCRRPRRGILLPRSVLTKTA